MKDRDIAHLVALHYAKIGWAVTPSHHRIDPDKQGVACGKHPTVAWKEEEVQAGRIVGPTTDPDEVRDYWLGPDSDPRGADVCIHTKPSRLLTVDCDRSWKFVVVEESDGSRISKRVFRDGLASFSGFMGGSFGTDLLSTSKRGVHFHYAVESELAAKIGNRNGWLLGVDVRGAGPKSGGVTIETNGVCPHREWVRGAPRIEISDDHPEGEIVGLEPYPEIRFDTDGTCVDGLPKLVGGRVEGIRPPPDTLLQALLESRATQPTSSGLRKRHRQAKAARTRNNAAGSEHGAKVDARASASRRPYQFKARCTCGDCANFAEAAELLAWVPPEVSYEAWRNVLWGVSDLLYGSKCGEHLVAEWSNMSIVPERRDPDQARCIYRSDDRHLAELLS